MQKAVKIVAALAAGASARTWKDEIPSFEEYCQESGLSYSGSELTQRRELYEKSVEQVKSQNSNPHSTWKAAVNEFAVMTPEEKKAMTGYMKKTGGKPNFGVSPMVHTNSPPSSFDWRDARPNVVTAVKNQGSCGSCWAFASSAVMESVIAIDTGVLFDLSPQQITSCTPNPDECGGSGGCTGATAQLAFNYTIQSGITSQWTYPYTSGSNGDSGSCNPLQGTKTPVAGITSYVQLPQNDAAALLSAVLVSPVAVSVAASDWGLYSSGIFDMCDLEHPIINHAVVLMGYGIENGHEYWLIRNSWSPTWGENGYIRLARYPEEEPCGVDNKPLDGYSCKSNPPASIVACGMCGILSDSSYPSGGFLGKPQGPSDPALSTQAPPQALVQPHVASDAGLPDFSDGAAFIQRPLEL